MSLTDEDKQWIKSVFAQQKEEIDFELEGVKNEIVRGFMDAALMQPVEIPQPSGDGRTFDEMIDADVLKDKWLLYRNMQSRITKDSSATEISQSKKAFYAGARALYVLIANSPDRIKALDQQGEFWDRAASGYMPFAFWKW